MKRWIAWLGFAVLLGAAGVRADRALGQLAADRMVGEVSRLGRAAASDGTAPRVLLAYVRGLREAREKDPTNIRVLAARGDLFLLLGRPESAVEAYDSALELEPRAEIYFNRSLALERLGRSREAAEDRDRALILDPRLGLEAAKRRRDRPESRSPDGVKRPGS